MTHRSRTQIYGWLAATSFAAYYLIPDLVKFEQVEARIFLGKRGQSFDLRYAVRGTNYVARNQLPPEHHPFIDKQSSTVIYANRVWPYLWRWKPLHTEN